MNPLVAKALTVLGMTGAVLGLSYASKSRQKTPKTSKKSPLEGIFSEGARVPERIVNDVMLPVHLTFSPRVMALDGTISEGSNNITNQVELANLVIDITSERANIAYEWLLHLVADEEVNMGDPSKRDEVVQRTVAIIAPRVDWTQGLVYAFNSSEGLVWRGVQTLAEIAHQSYWNKQAIVA